MMRAKSTTISRPLGSYRPCSPATNIFLRSVEDGQLLALDELVAFGGVQAQRIAAAFEREEKLFRRDRLPMRRYSPRRGATPRGSEHAQCRPDTETRRHRRSCIGRPPVASCICPAAADRMRAQARSDRSAGRERFPSGSAPCRCWQRGSARCSARTRRTNRPAG